MNGKSQLNGKEILEKDFKTAMRGYNQEEVDEFLDVIIHDYDYFNQEIERLNKEVQELRKATAAPERPAQRQQIRAQQPNTQVNYDVLKRLSNLEKEVFGKKYASEDE